MLGLLSSGEQSGYDLKKRADSSVGYFWTPAKSRIYAILPRLVDAGLVRRRDLRQQRRPDKQLYRLTAEGRAALVEWLTTGPLEPDPDRNLLLLKLFFGKLAGPDALIEQVRARRQEIERFRAELEEIDSTPRRNDRDDLYPADSNVRARVGRRDYRLGEGGRAGTGPRRRGQVMRLAVLLGVFLVAAAVASAAPDQDRYRDSPGGMHPTATRPPPLRLHQRCVTRAERRRVVRFRAVDGVRLIGVLLGGGPRAVVLAHQGGEGGSDLCVWMPYARSLVRAGYRVLAFDHRSHGSSGQARTVARLTRVDLDVLGAIRLLRARGARGIVLAGGSLGGAAVIAAGATAGPPVQGVISFASPTRFGTVDALAAAGNLRVPSFFLSADGDEGFPEAAQALFNATPADDKRIWIFPGTRHGAPVLRDLAVKQTVDGWIREHLQLG